MAVNDKYVFIVEPKMDRRGSKEVIKEYDKQRKHLQAVIETADNYKEIDKALESHTRQMKKVTDEYKGSKNAKEKTIKKAEEYIDSLEKERKSLQTNIAYVEEQKKTEKELAAQREKEAKERLKQLDKEERETKKAEEAKQKAQQKAEEKKRKEIESTQKKQEKARESFRLKMIDTFSKVGAKAEALGRAMTTSLTLPFIALSKYGFDFALEFDEAMNRVAAVTGLPRAELLELEQVATDLGRTTTKTGAQAAEAMNILALAGKDVNEIMALTPGVIKLAEISMMDTADAADSLVSIINQFGIPVEQSSHAIDVLAKAATSANVTVHSLAEGMKFVGPVAEQVGFDMEEVAAMMAVMGDNGIKAGIAGRALRMAFIRMAGPTDKSMELYGELNEEIQGMIDGDEQLMSVINELTGEMEGMTKTSKAQFLQTMFGTRAMSGLSTVVGEGAAEYEELVDSLYNAEGATEAMQKAIVGPDSLYGSFALLKSSLQEAARLFTSAAEGPMINFFQRAKEIVDVFIEMDDAQRQQILSNLAFIASIGPIVMVIGKLISGIATGIKMFAALKAAMAAMGAASGVAAAGAGLLTGALWLIPIAAIGLGIWKLIDTIGVFKGEIDDTTGKINSLGEDLIVDTTPFIDSMKLGQRDYESILFELSSATREEAAEMARALSLAGGALADDTMGVLDTFKNSIDDSDIPESLKKTYGLMYDSWSEEANALNNEMAKILSKDVLSDADWQRLEQIPMELRNITDEATDSINSMTVYSDGTVKYIEESSQLTGKMISDLKEEILNSALEIKDAQNSLFSDNTVAKKSSDAAIAYYEQQFNKLTRLQNREEEIRRERQAANFDEFVLNQIETMQESGRSIESIATITTDRWQQMYQEYLDDLDANMSKTKQQIIDTYNEINSQSVKDIEYSVVRHEVTTHQDIYVSAQTQNVNTAGRHDLSQFSDIEEFVRHQLEISGMLDMPILQDIVSKPIVNLPSFNLNKETSDVNLGNFGASLGNFAERASNAVQIPSSVVNNSKAVTTRTATSNIDNSRHQDNSVGTWKQEFVIQGMTPQQVMRMIEENSRRQAGHLNRGG